VHSKGRTLRAIVAQHPHDCKIINIGDDKQRSTQVEVIAAAGMQVLVAVATVAS
jgi:hypothetical protein